MTRLRSRIAAATLSACALWPTTSAAHPHIFVDAGLRLIMAEGRIEAVEVTWIYDELFSLLLLEDHSLDPDFDMVLTEAEVAQILGFDLDWTHGFEGGLTLDRGAGALEIGAPEAVSLEMLESGQLQTVHRREVVDTGGTRLLAQVYDAEFYVAFEMTGEMVVIGAECDAELIRADLDAAYAGLDAAMESIGGAVAAEDNFPEIGALFADQVVFECAG